MLLRRLEIRNVRKIKQADIDFHGPGLQIIQGMNESGKSTIAQSIALSMEGPKACPLGIINRGVDKAEILAYLEGEQELKIRTVITDSVKQTVSRKDALTGNYTALSGGVRAFLDSIRSGLEMPWAMRDMPDAKIIELLKEKAGISGKIANIDAAIKDKETARTEVGRDKKKIGELKPVMETKHPPAIDTIKAEREQGAEFLKWKRSLFDAAAQIIREGLVVDSVPALKDFGDQIIGLAASIEEKLSSVKQYTQEAIDTLDDKVSAWHKEEEQAKVYDLYLQKKRELDTLSSLYDSLTQDIEALREQRRKTLTGMNLKVKGLEIGEDNFLYHNGAVRGITETNRTGNWSTAESVKVFFSIGSRFSGDLKVLVVDNAEGLDEKTTKAISDWAENSQSLVILLKVASVPEELEEGIIYLKEGEVLTK